ncbi:MAG: hypothetical protein U9N79_10020 [Actinomycetota bacterium]|nr:hypothetical protein [Actinomycetota bacterium]
MFETLSATLGAGDCEALGSGWLIQPVAAWTSLAYAVVGIALMMSAPATRHRERSLRSVFGILLIATGIGSFLYHGPQPAIAAFAHDITFLTTLWFLIIMNPASPYGILRGWAWGAVVSVSAIMTIALILVPTSTNLLAAVSIAALVVSDLLMHRVGGIDGRWYAAALALFAAALVFNALGRTGAPTCVPDDVIQFHGLWHILSAPAFGAYFVATVRPRNQEPSS